MFFDYVSPKLGSLATLNLLNIFDNSIKQALQNANIFCAKTFPFL